MFDRRGRDRDGRRPTAVHRESGDRRRAEVLLRGRVALQVGPHRTLGVAFRLAGCTHFSFFFFRKESKT